MPKRTRARSALLTFAAQPWTLFEDDPGAGGGGGGGGAPTVNEHGYPEATPVADMSSEHQVAYWRYHSKKWETTAKAGPDSSELERLRAAETELNTRKAAELSETERLQAERDAATAEAATAKAERDAAARKALVLEIAAGKGLTPAQAARLQGSTKEELEADADALKALFGTSNDGQGSGSTQHRSGGNRGGDVGNAASITAGEERYRARHGK
ncbi:hypothetical protein [Streptomyces sp. NBC_00076]|uniref:hypothetical protein n=1 Tax=Streptomyces sp. NBC_00076 TaxID=2975642 RepID=UPI003252401D